MLRVLAALMLAAAVSGPLPAQRPIFAPPLPASASTAAATDALHSPGKDVSILLLTMGNGEQVWELFGHSAIWIHDNVTARDTVFNWGVFDSSQPHFIPHFLKGLMLYSMGGDSIDQMIAAYRYYNRTVISQELDLTVAQKDSLLHLIQINALPANRQYRYDYFRDNCATRPRDLIDQILGGQLHEYSRQVMPTSYRWHTLRLMQSDKLLDIGVDIGLGEPSDRPITKWDEMFLPHEMHDVIATMPVRDSTGATHPLVRRETVMFQSTRPAEPSAPPNMAPWLTIIGVVIGAIFAFVGFAAMAGSKAARLAASILVALWSLAAGTLGVVLTILWTATDHVFAHANENLLLFNPLWLVLAILFPVYIMSARAVPLVRGLVFLLASLIVVALLAHVVRLSPQSNLALIGLALPPALGIAWTVTRRRGHSYPLTTVSRR